MHLPSTVMRPNYFDASRPNRRIIVEWCIISQWTGVGDGSAVCSGDDGVSDVRQRRRGARDALGRLHRVRHHRRDAVQLQLRLLEVSVEDRGRVRSDHQRDAVRLRAGAARVVVVVERRLRVGRELLPVRRHQGGAVAPLVPGLRRPRSQAVRLLVGDERHRDPRRQPGGVQSEGTVPHLL